MQFAGALSRFTAEVRHSHPRHEPAYLAKHDIKDGYCRMFLNAPQCLRLAMIPPRYDGEKPLVATPMSITMGWVMSPLTFCVMSETIADRANANFRAQPVTPPDHRLREAAEARDDLRPAGSAPTRNPKPLPGCELWLARQSSSPTTCRSRPPATARHSDP